MVSTEIPESRKYCRQRGLPEVYLVSIQGFGHEDPREIGFDAAVEFPPHNNPGVTVSGLEILNPSFSGMAYDLSSLVSKAQSRYQAECPYDLFPTVMPSWDNEARRPGGGHVFVGASPGLYAEWLRSACCRSLRAESSDKRLVFVNAWNEWAEGAYLEPDRRYGFAYLKATVDVLSSLPGLPAVERGVLTQASRPSKPGCRVLLVGHDANFHGAQLNLLHLARLFSRQFGLQPVVWLLEGGPLLPDYQAIAPVQVLGADSDAWVESAHELRRQGMDFAITNTVVVGTLVPVLRGAGFRVVSLVHEMPQLIGDRHLQLAAEAIAQHAHCVVFAANTVGEAFSAVADLDWARVAIIPQGIYQSLRAGANARERVRLELGLPDTCTLVINVGYGDRRKGLDYFIECARRLSAEDPRFVFVWIGSIAPEMQDLFDIAHPSEKLAKNLCQVPFTDDVARYYAAADMFLLTSREDPFPSVVLEALASGLPVVAFEGSGGHCELLRDPINGLLVAPLGNISAMTAALKHVYAEEAGKEESRHRRAEMAKRRFDFLDYGFELLRLQNPGLLRVSVVVPNYNYARYLEDRLESIFRQTYPLYEVIVLDDASTDGSDAVIKRTSQACNRNVKLVTNATNSGSVFAQWAKGIRLASGELVWIAEADDVAQPAFLESLSDAMARDPRVVFAYSDSSQVDVQGRTIGETYADYCNEYSALDFTSSFTLETHQFLFKGLAVKNSVLNVSSVLFRRDNLLEALETAEQELLSWNIAGDWRLYVELCRQQGRVAYGNRILNAHRRHDESVVGSNRLEAHIDEIRRMQELIRSLAALDKPTIARQSAYVSDLIRRACEDSRGDSQDLRSSKSAGDLSVGDHFEEKKEIIGELSIQDQGTHEPNSQIDETEWPDDIQQSCDAAAESFGVSPRIHEKDYIFRFVLSHPCFETKSDAIQYYFRDGKNSARTFRNLVDRWFAYEAKPLDILEFASGYGAVSRHLKYLLHPHLLHCCDIHPQANRFVSSELNLPTIQSTDLPGELQLPRSFDVIFALSFFSHMPELTWACWLKRLYDGLKVGGVLIFTTHGNKSLTHFPHAELNLSGFWYESSSEQEDLKTVLYGQTITSSYYVNSRLADLDGARLLEFQEGA